jgi:hypothetical protein
LKLKIRGGGGLDFVANLIVLDSKSIDVILVMNSLSKHKILIDYSKKSIKLTTPDRNGFKYVKEPIVTYKGAANRVKLNQSDANPISVVPVVNEFSDVFSEGLLGIPPD